MKYGCVGFYLRYPPELCPFMNFPYTFKIQIMNKMLYGMFLKYLNQSLFGFDCCSVVVYGEKR